MLTLPTIIFGLVVALLIGAVYHFIRGGSGWMLLLYLGLSTLGFASGQALSMWRGWSLFMFGVLDIGLGAIGSAVFLIFGEWLSHIEVKNESGV